MICLASTSDKLQVVTGQAVTVDMHASWVDLSGTTVTPGRTNAVPSTAVTTDLVGSPASSTYRTVKSVSIRNRHAALSCDITVKHTDGSIVPELIKVSLPPAHSLSYDEGRGWKVLDNQGQTRARAAQSDIGLLKCMVCDVDQIADVNATINTLPIVPTLAASGTYWFRAVIAFHGRLSGVADATIGGLFRMISRHSTTGGFTVISYHAAWGTAATTELLTYAGAVDLPASGSGTSLGDGNLCVIEGLLLCSSAAEQIRIVFAPENTLNATLVSTAGSFLQWMKLA